MKVFVRTTETAEATDENFSILLKSNNLYDWIIEQKPQFLPQRSRKEDLKLAQNTMI